MSSLAFLPITAVDWYIVGNLHSIAVRLLKMQDQKYLTLHWFSVDTPLTLTLDMVTTLSEAFWPRKVADSSIMGQCSHIAPQFFKMHGLKSLLLHWRSFLGHSDDVVESSFA